MAKRLGFFKRIENHYFVWAESRWVWVKDLRVLANIKPLPLVVEKVLTIAIYLIRALLDEIEYLFIPAV